MKMRNCAKRFCAITLIASMAFAALTGCGGSEATEEQASLGDSFHAEGMPIVDEQVTIDVLTTRWGSMGDSFTANQFLVDLEEASNVNIEWQVQSLNDWGEQKSILLAGGELPSVFIGSQSLSDADILNNLDYFIPLDDLIENYMPNYKKILEECPELRNMTTFPDGHIYSLGRKLPARPKTSNQPIINKKWLDNLGLDVPTTIDELEAVLRAFKEQDANGNGDPNDEIPICGIDMYLISPFGYDAIDSDMMLKDGEVYYAKTSEEYKEGIKWLQKMYADGIIDPESFTQDDTMATAKRQDPNVSRVGFAYAWIPDATFGQWSDEYIAIAPIAGPDGERHSYGNENGIASLGRNEAVITTACKYPEVVARWLDQFYTDEATIQNFWGAIGTVIDKDENGNYTLLDPPEGTSADAWYWEQSLRDFGPGYVTDELINKLHLSPESGDGLKLELAKMGDDYIGTPFPTVMYTAEETEELATITTDTDKYIGEMEAAWITDSSRDIDAEWDEFINQLNVMGFERLVEIKVGAYNRYIGSGK